MHSNCLYIHLRLIAAPDLPDTHGGYNRTDIVADMPARQSLYLAVSSGSKTVPHNCGNEQMSVCSV